MSNLTVPLPAKEQKIFDQMSKQFDNREYAKAVRSADSILAGFPEHGETLAMKGLTLHTMDKKEEGIALVKLGVAKSMRSGICWHSLGMCYRSDKNFIEAQKTFKIASQRDPKNMSVLRDLSSLSVQLRDWDSFFDSREKLLGLKANIRANWVALSCAYRQLGQTELAAAIMDVMVQIMDAGDNRVETSEIHLYRAELEIMSNHPDKALEILTNKDIIDTQIQANLRAKAFSMMGKMDKAEKEYIALIGEKFAEGDCIIAIANLRKIKLGSDNFPKDAAAAGKMLSLLDEIAALYPKCDYARRAALDCVPIGEFEARLRAYVAPFIQKMIPSLFSVLKTLYRSEERAKIIGSVFQQWEQELKDKNFSSFGNVENPALLMWLHAFMASHFTRLRNFEQAHQYITMAIEHTPTVEMLYLMRAKIFHREGKFSDAAEWADKARLLDLQDKYLNGKCAKYQFRAGLIKKGEETMQLFYKPTTVNDTFLVALESQCAWYEREVGDAFFVKGDVVSALQNYLMYEKHHINSHDELLDFHGYVFRRCNVRAWFDVIARDDGLSSNQFFLRLCPRIVRAYLRVAELGEQAIRSKHQPREKPAATDDEGEDKRRSQLWDDYYLANIDLQSPLLKAQRYVEALLQNRWGLEETHVVAIEYYLSLKKPLLAMQSLTALRTMNSSKVTEFGTSISNMLANVELDSRIITAITTSLASN